MSILQYIYYFSIKLHKQCMSAILPEAAVPCCGLRGPLLSALDTIRGALIIHFLIHNY